MHSDNSHIYFALYFGCLGLAVLIAAMVDDWLHARSKARALAARREERAKARLSRQSETIVTAGRAVRRQEGFQRVEQATRTCCAPDAVEGRKSPLLIANIRHGDKIVAWPLHLN